MLLCPSSVTEIMTVETTVMNLDVVSVLLSSSNFIQVLHVYINIVICAFDHIAVSLFVGLCDMYV